MDIDTIFLKSPNSIFDLDYDFIISRGECEDKCWPHECSAIIGFGACTGFYIAKPTALDFCKLLLTNMLEKKFGGYSDQLTIMKMFVECNTIWKNKEVTLDGITYTVKETTMMGIRICCLDFNMFERGLYFCNRGQYGNHFSPNKIGGLDAFISIMKHMDNIPYIKSIYTKAYTSHIRNQYSKDEIEYIDKMNGSLLQTKIQ